MRSLNINKINSSCNERSISFGKTGKDLVVRCLPRGTPMWQLIAVTFTVHIDQDVAVPGIAEDIP